MNSPFFLSQEEKESLMKIPEVEIRMIVLRNLELLHTKSMLEEQFPKIQKKSTIQEVISSYGRNDDELPQEKVYKLVRL